MHIIDHIRELRRRVVAVLLGVAAAALVAFVFYDRLIGLLTAPFAGLDLSSANRAPLFVTTVTEGFLIRIKTSIVAGFVASLPFTLYQVLRFVFPGLRRTERRTVAATLASSFALAVIGFLYSYVQVVPISLRFLTGDGFVPKDVGYVLSFARNVGFILQFLLAAVVLFQLPILMVVLMRLSVFTRRGAFRAGRYVVVAVFVISAMLTPPDFVSQVSLAVPLTAMYFLAIFVARVFRFGEP